MAEKEEKIEKKKWKEWQIFLVIGTVVTVAVVLRIAIGFGFLAQKHSPKEDRKPASVQSGDGVTPPMGYKPVIYLYPTQVQKTLVQLDFAGELIADYPRYDWGIGGWEVVAYPEGKIVNLEDGKEYSYLFWEGEFSEDKEYDLGKGFIVKGSESREFLRDKLEEMGLTPNEYNEFIVYWYPKMMNNNYNLVHFANEEEYGQYAPLTITPKPDSMLRVFMVFRGLESMPERLPEEQRFEKFRREGFAVVEWGGDEV